MITVGPDEISMNTQCAPTNSWLPLICLKHMLLSCVFNRVAPTGRNKQLNWKTGESHTHKIENHDNFKFKFRLKVSWKEAARFLIVLNVSNSILDWSLSRIWIYLTDWWTRWAGSSAAGNELNNQLESSVYVYAHR